MENKDETLKSAETLPNFYANQSMSAEREIERKELFQMGESPRGIDGMAKVCKLFLSFFLLLGN